MLATEWHLALSIGSRFGVRQSQSPISVVPSAYVLGAVAAILVVKLALPTLLPAHISLQPMPTLRFDVASLKIAADQNHFEMTPERSPGRFTWTTQGFDLVEYAYHLQRWQISGDTGRLASIYQLEATTAPGATENDERQMVQSLLEATEGDVPPLPDALRASCGNPPKVEDRVTATAPGRGVTAITGCRATMTHLTEKLEQMLDTTVLDQTDLNGKYYFAFDYATDADPDVLAPDLPDAISALGLRLSKYKGPAEVLVIDHIDQIPTPN